MKTPTVHVHPIANRYAVPGERVIEFSNAKTGGLISLRATEDGDIVIEVYRCDPGITVHGPRPR